MERNFVQAKTREGHLKKRRENAVERALQEMIPQHGKKNCESNLHNSRSRCQKRGPGRTDQKFLIRGEHGISVE